MLNLAYCQNIEFLNYFIAVESEMKKIGRRILQTVDMKRKGNEVVSDQRLPSEDNKPEAAYVNEIVVMNDNPVTRSTTPAASYNERDDKKINVKDTMKYNTDKPTTSTSANQTSEQITEAMTKKMDDIILYVKKKKDSMTNQGLIECGIWDFAGQKENYATHQTFFTPHAIYLLVVDIEDEIKPIHCDKFNFDSSGGKILKLYD